MSEAVKGGPSGSRDRPQFRNISITQLPNYRLPLSGIVSILHRISGLLLFVLLPFILYLLEQSLTSELSFAYLKGIASNLCIKLILLVMSWAFMHHLCAGIRHLFMDLHYGLDKASAKKTSATVLIVSLVLTTAIALKLFGAF